MIPPQPDEHPDQTLSAAAAPILSMTRDATNV